MSYDLNISPRFALLFVLLVACSASKAQTQSASLADLQRDYAMRYLEPEPHMALAKYYFDHGNRLEAFYTLEAARRGRFEEKVFDPAFYRAFDGFDNSKTAEARLLAEYARNPDSVETIDRLADIYISREDYVNAKRYLLAAIQKKPEDYKFTGGLASILSRQGKRQEADQLEKEILRKFPETAEAYSIRAEKLTQTKPLEAKIVIAEGLKRFPTDGQLLFDLGVVYQGEDYQKAEETFVKAAAQSPKSEFIQMWVGRFFFKVRQDNRRALDYYLTAYFLNPHAYETEYVESRIQKITYELASKKFEEQTRSGVSMIAILTDPDPAVVGMALEQMSENWSAAYIDPVVQLMGHDDPGVRWQATQTLKTNVDALFDERLKSLLRDDDLRQRGLAAYIAVYRWKHDSFATVKNLLREQSQLVRFDAVSALMMEGGPAGRKLALAHAALEPHPTLKKLILAKPDSAGDP